MNILLLHDEVGSGSSADELDVLNQMDAIEVVLTELGHAHQRLACSLNLGSVEAAIRQSGVDLVFNLVESLGGQGRLIQTAPALLDTMGVPYTGCPSDAVWLTSNKLVAKKLLTAAGVATPEWFTLDQLERGTTVPGGRYIIKSVWEHASRGLDDASVVETSRPETLAAALRERLPLLGGEGFAERYIDGREFNLSLLAIEQPRGKAENPVLPRCEILPPAEIVFDGYDSGKPRVVGYRAKWDEGSFEYHHTPRRFDFGLQDASLLRTLHATARDCWDCFGLRGYARVDFRVDPQGKPYVLEVNTNPCLSPDAGFAAALERANLPFLHAIARIMADARRWKG